MKDDQFRELENKSIFIIREAFKKFKKIAVLCSMGKDSVVVLWLSRKAFFGKIPFPVIHLDTSYKFPEIYDYRDKIAKDWDLDLIIARNEEALKNGMGPKKGKLACCTALKTEALKQVIAKEKIEALLLGIRRDEHGIRSKERYFSPRDKNFQWDYKNQPTEMWDFYSQLAEDQDHMRIHPILDWTELDVWRYVKQEKIPVNPLYFSRHGKRYRSLGCMPCTKAVKSHADTIDKIIAELKTTQISERSGRDQDKEKAYVMQRLRVLGYM